MSMGCLLVYFRDTFYIVYIIDRRAHTHAYNHIIRDINARALRTMTDLQY